MRKILFSLLCFLTAWCNIHAQISAPFVDVAVSDGRIVSASGHKVGQGKGSVRKTDHCDSVKLDGHGSTYLIIYNTKRKDFDTKCFSGVFRLAFDDEDTTFTARPLVIKLDADRKPVFTILADETDLLGPDITIKTDTPVEPEKFYDFGFSYSVRDNKAVAYLNGRKVGEVNGFLPVIRDVTYLHCGGYFDGKIARFRLFNGVVNGDTLTYDQNAAKELEPVKEILKDLALKRKNPFIPALAETMLFELERTQNIYHPSVSDWRTIKNAVQTLRILAEKIDHGFPAKNIIAILAYPGRELQKKREFDFYAPAGLDKLCSKIPMIASANEKTSTLFSILPLAKIQSLKAEISDLKDPSGALIPAKNISIGILGKQLRNGYVFPAPPVTDGDLIQTDELRRTVQMRLDYIDGIEYAPLDELKHSTNVLSPQNDNAPLQNVGFERAMTQKYFVLSASIPKDAKEGFYTGTIRFTADGIDAGSVKIALRVFPLVLPDERDYSKLLNTKEGDLSRPELIYRALQQKKEAAK